MSSSRQQDTPSFRFVDIGANLLDERFTAGIYRGTFRHEPDLDWVVQRAQAVGVRRIVVTAGTVDESRQALDQARIWNQEYPGIHFYSTVGVHPTRCQQVFVDNDKSDEELLDELLQICRDGMTDQTVVAVGEIGLDYDRLEFCPKDIQQLYLKRQLTRLVAATGLPVFFHNRSVGADLYEIVSEYNHSSNSSPIRGVVHSFDDSLELAEKFINDLNLYIGLNGCSLRTEDSLAVARALPLNRILLETDSPYCEVRSTHPGFSYIQTKWESKAEKKFQAGKTVKSRQEPCHVIQVAEVVAGVKGVPLAQVADACYQNSLNLYGWKEDKQLEPQTRKVESQEL